MKKILGCFGLSAVLVIILFSNAWAEEPPKKEILVEVLAIEMSQNVLNEFVSPGSSETKGFIPPDRIDAVKLVQSFSSLLNDKKVSLAQNPRITAYDGTKTTFETTEPVFYLEKIDKDTFKLKKLTGKEGAGTFLEATPTITKDGQINVEYKLTIQKVQKRAPIEGIEGLDVGFPLLGVRSASSNLTLNEGQPKVAGMSQGGGQCFLVILTAKINK
ncbi:MAG: hypothetical protein WC081_02385 [Candidatus Ratteibacteria bacterium]|jgi:type II secretory pathway component GspD/PulD (secretin)